MTNSVVVFSCFTEQSAPISLLCVSIPLLDLPGPPIAYVDPDSRFVAVNRLNQPQRNSRVERVQVVACTLGLWFPWAHRHRD